MFRETVSRHTPSYWDHTMLLLCKRPAAGPMGQCVAVCDGPSVRDLFVCATARAERWYITIIIAVITVPDEHTAWRALKERWRNSTSDPCGLYSSYFIPAVNGHRPTRDGPQTSWLVLSLIHLLHSLLRPYTVTQTYQELSVTTRIAFIIWFANFKS